MSLRTFKVGVISIHAPRVGGDGGPGSRPTRTEISIHAPRVGGDECYCQKSNREDYISIHAPRVGGDTGSAHILPLY